MKRGVTKTWTTSDGSVITVNGTTISFLIVKTKPTTATFDFSPHPWGERAVTYLLDNAEEWASNTLSSNATRLVVLLHDYLHPEQDLDPEAFRTFCRWLRQSTAPGAAARYAPGVDAQIARQAISFYAHALGVGPGDRNLELMREAARREFRGTGAAQYTAGAAEAFSAAEYQGLLAAAASELAECRRLLDLRRAFKERIAPERQAPKPVRRSGSDADGIFAESFLYALLDWVVAHAIPCELNTFSELAGVTRLSIASRYRNVAAEVREWAFVSGARPLAAPDRFLPTPDPYAAFAVLVGLRNGVRAEEWNLMRVGDVRNGYLTVRTDDHTEGENESREEDLKIERATEEIYNLLIAWTEDVRAAAPAHLRGRLHLAAAQNGRVFQVDTTTLSVSRLPAFYKRYFERRAEGAVGSNPVLHAEGDPSRPFEAPFLKFRNASIRHFIDHEENLAFVQGFSRHKHASTVRQYYSHRHATDMDEVVAIALGPTAQVVEMALKGEVVEEISPELQDRIDRGGATPFGVCGDPNLPDSQEEASLVSGCTAAPTCLECDHLHLHVAKLPVLQADLEQCLTRAAEAEADGYLRDAENFRGAASLRQAHINRIEKLMAKRRAR
jgi:hypothetical protein